jgi:putative flavoprotein involved in K+ transport
VSAAKRRWSPGARPLSATDVVVVGGGHCGLAMSHALAQRSIEHCLLERREVGDAWRSERWDSLRLLTPNWMTQLPGHAYQGDDPHGYLRAAEVADLLSAYAARISAPVLTGTTVSRVSATSGGWRVETDRGDWVCRALVMATGAFSRPVVPALAADVPAGIRQVTAQSYRHPGRLDPGGVLVVGASASGLQIAQEIQRSGRAVTLAVGEHVRMPRLYRGRDVQWWMLASGVLDQRIEDMDDPVRARRVPSPQLAGSPERASLDLNSLREEGVRIAGRLMGVRDGKAQFSGSLRNVCALADLKMTRLLDHFDDWARRAGHATGTEAAGRFAPTVVDASPLLTLDLPSCIRTVVWATGMQPDHRWLDLPVFDRRGELRHHGGIVDGPEGLYVLGLPFMRRRKSSFIHGAGDDVLELVAHLHAHLDRTARLPRAERRAMDRTLATPAAPSPLSTFSSLASENAASCST